MYAWGTFGGYRLRWLTDTIEIPRFLPDLRFLSNPWKKIRQHRSFIIRWVLSVIVAYLWGQILYLAIPNSWLSFLGGALGVWAIKKIEIKHRNPYLTICLYYVTFLTSRHIYENSIIFSIMMIMVLDTHWAEVKSISEEKQWVFNTPSSFFWIIAANMLHFASICMYLWLVCTESIKNNDIPRFQAIYRSITSFRWADFKQFLYDVGEYTQRYGWYDIWKQILDSWNSKGEQNPYDVLGVSPLSSQREITSKWRALIKEYHPDKCKDPDKLWKIHNKFIEIQQAYEALSKTMNKRMQKNMKSL